MRIQASFHPLNGSKAFSITILGLPKVAKTMHAFFSNKIACMASGLTTTSRFGHGMLQIMSHPAAWKTDLATLAIHRDFRNGPGPLRKVLFLDKSLG